MTNFEFYKDTLAEIAKTGDDIAIVKGKPRQCAGINCNECERNDMCVEANLLKWLLSEHVEKPKLTRRERCFCEVFCKGWLVRSETGALFFYSKKPVKKIGGWTPTGGVAHCFDLLFAASEIEKLDFSMIKESDSEPWSVEDLLKLEVEQ